jgi:hypothetical protein
MCVCACVYVCVCRVEMGEQLAPWVALERKLSVATFPNTDTVWCVSEGDATMVACSTPSTPSPSYTCQISLVPLVTGEQWASELARRRRVIECECEYMIVCVVCVVCVVCGVCDVCGVCVGVVCYQKNRR